MVYQEEFTIETSGHGDTHDITHRVGEIIAYSGIGKGTAQVFHVGSTGVIAAIEYEPGLARDLPDLLDRLIPPGRDYGHEQAWHDGNAHSHLQATSMGHSFSFPVSNGAAVLGTWQQIIHLECDIKPRRRRIFVTVMGESGPARSGSMPIVRRN